jgi:ribosomal protein L7/L12
MAVKIVCDFYDLQEAVRALAGGEMEASHLRGRMEEKDRTIEDLRSQIHGLKMEMKAAATSPSSNPFVREHVEGLIRAVSTGQKIGAIKEVRSMLGLGLKEAKDLVEAQWGKLYNF